MPRLLAVDVGLRTGLAWYGADGRLLAYRSQHLSNRSVLRRAVRNIVLGDSELTHLVLEGGGSIADIWGACADTGQIGCLRISAEDWRSDLLLKRTCRSGIQAKAEAIRLAREVIEWSGARRPTTVLRHDAAEAILAGLWGAVAVGLLPGVPECIRRRQ